MMYAFLGVTPIIISIIIIINVIIIIVITITITIATTITITIIIISFAVITMASNMCAFRIPPTSSSGRPRGKKLSFRTLKIMFLEGGAF